MADRSDYLRQLQEQLTAWAQWAKQLEDKALASAAQMRGDAQANYEHRARQVGELIVQGREQMEIVGGATEDAWRDLGSSAEHTWETLQAAAAVLAKQIQEKINEPVPKRAPAGKKVVARKPAAKKTTVRAKAKAVARKGRKKVAAVRAKVSAAGKKVVRKAKSIARTVKAKVRRNAAKRKVARKVRAVRRKVAKVARKKK